MKAVYPVTPKRRDISIGDDLTISQASRLLALSRPDMHRALKAGALPHFMHGHRKMIAWKDAYSFPSNARRAGRGGAK
jgi:hypothetical protein